MQPQASLLCMSRTGTQLYHTIAGACEERLYRVLRAAVQIGLFQVVLPKKGDTGVKFQNNKRSALLRDGHPNCLKHMVGRPAMKADHLPISCVMAFLCITATDS